ncbi:hypothetical protein IEQ34_008264 [Dendrobium chrysotoxum]|uniref:NB-ARC domain-containing protein n=1 Tax=Dendrobium chrysotoxum TaxID=161865 RepID=A0AAV7H6Z6_DENCH|nr:hypothetical protein IEQ34_008264 [Dendrobium chrysotoxum]
MLFVTLRKVFKRMLVLKDSLRFEVMSKKFLLVLDDIWEEEENDKIKWENVLAPLAFGSLGSKILITTLIDSVALMIANVIKKKETLRLEGLEEDECLQLRNSHAFADVENLGDHKKLRSIAGEIAKKLLGSPLAAKVIGGVLNSDFDEKLGQNDIFPILRLSYMFLPKHLQNCFAFCCILPQDHWLDIGDLVRMWIASGFILPPCIRGEAGRILEEVKKSFFNKIQFQHITYCKMHDLLHELAQFISAQECFRVVRDEELFFTIPKTIQHLSVDTNNLKVLKKIGKFKILRTLYFIEKHPSLYIYALCLKMMPEAIGYLILFHLLGGFPSLSLCTLETCQKDDSDCVFASLEVLHIERLEALEDWLDSTLAAEDDRLFACLIELYLKDCPKLQDGRLARIGMRCCGYCVVHHHPVALPLDGTLCPFSALPL